MRLRFACMTAFGLTVLATQIHAAGVDCVALELSDSEQVAAVMVRIARTDEAAMKQFMRGIACLDDDAQVAMGRSAGEFFDQKPRAYLQLIATGEPKDVSWLEALLFAPEKIQPDPVARLGTLARRADTLKANADLISPGKFGHIWLQFLSGIERLGMNIASRFPEPLVMIDPLAGIEFDVGSVLIEPATPDWLPMMKFAHGPNLRVFGHARGNNAELYLLIAGFSLRFSPDGMAIEGIDNDKGWIERVDTSGNRVEVLAPASELFTSPRIPREISVALCQNAVERLDRVLKDGRLQRALDERLLREPNAGLFKPLRDAFTKAGINVMRYREIAVPGAGH